MYVYSDANCDYFRHYVTDNLNINLLPQPQSVTEQMLTLQTQLTVQQTNQHPLEPETLCSHKLQLRQASYFRNGINYAS